MSKLTTLTEARMQHANAPLTPNGRLRMVRLVVEKGFTFEAAAAASNVAKSTLGVGASLAGSQRRRTPHARLPGGPAFAAAVEPQPDAGRRGRADLRAARQTERAALKARRGQAGGPRRRSTSPRDRRGSRPGRAKGHGDANPTAPPRAPPEDRAGDPTPPPTPCPHAKRAAPHRPPPPSIRTPCHASPPR